MSISLSIPAEQTRQELKPKIMVVGVGGAGGNAVNDMIAADLDGVEFLVVNTDAQALEGSRASRKVQMGSGITHGLGAGAKPEVGAKAAEESLDEIMEHLDGSNMVFITVGMGGGTGTGGAPVIARAARELGILTVGVVTKPFQFEGVHRMQLAEAGIEELEAYVDTLIVIPNQNLFRIANEKTTFAEAFRLADEVLYCGVRGVTELMIIPGLINLDFADIRSVMGGMGKAMMGTGEAAGERRALDAAEAAIANPLLDDISMKGARGVLINVTGGNDMTLFEVDEATNRIRSEVDEDAYIIFGTAFDGELEGRVRISVVAAGIDAEASKRAAPRVLSAMEQPLPAQVMEPQVNAPQEANDVAVPAGVSADAPLIPFPLSNPEATGREAGHEKVAEVADAATAPIENTPQPEARPDMVNGEEVARSENPESSKPATVLDEPSAEKPLAGAGSETVRENQADTPVKTVATAPVAPATPANQAAVEQRTAPPATPSIDAKESFIPPAPARVTSSDKAAPSNPFALSDLMNGSNKNPPTAAHGKAGASKSRAGSLFGRIMGAGKATGTNVQPLDWQNTARKPASTAPSATPSVTPESAPAINRVPPAPAEVSVMVPQTRLAGMEQTERAPVADQEEDLLDIPAFLRRQAN